MTALRLISPLGFVRPGDNAFGELADLYPVRPRRRLNLDSFDFRRILRPLKILDGQFYPNQPLQFLDGLSEARPIQSERGIVFTPLARYDSTLSTSSYSFTGVDFGATRADRIVGFYVNGIGSNDTTVTSAVIGGNSAALISKSAGSGTVDVAIGWALVPSGTTGQIINVTFSQSKNRASIYVFSLTGASTTLHDSTTVPTSTADPKSVAASLATNGLGLIFASNGNSSSTSGYSFSAESKFYDAISATNRIAGAALSAPGLVSVNQQGTSSAYAVGYVSFAPV